MKKAIISLLIGTFFFSSLCWGQTRIRAEGMAQVLSNRVDVARDKALDAALRNAVEKVVGVMVSSTTEVENFQVKMDTILSESKGFVNAYKVLSEGLQGDQYHVLIEADVGRERLRDRLTAINLIMTRKSKPRVMLLFSEQAPKDAIAEAAMSRFFMARGFKLVDAQLLRRERAGMSFDSKALSRLAGQHGAEVVLLGSVESATSSVNIGGIEMYTNKVTVSIKVINADTGEVITTDSRQASAPGMKGDIKKITEEAAEKLARQTLEEVLERWSSELVNAATVKLFVSGLESYEELQSFKEMLPGAVKGLREFHQRSYRQGQAEFDLELRGSSQSLADDLAAVQLGRKKVRILGITANGVEAGVTP